MRQNPLAYLDTELTALRDQGLFRQLRILDSEQKAHASFDHASVVNLSSNNYLGLTTHPRLRERAEQALRDLGVGSGSVRTIAGTMAIHMLRQFRRWSLADSDQGPVHLGYRLGHIKNEPRVFRAVVYNKGAAVLHMLRRLLGDDQFFAGLRAFYEDRKFQKAGTDDLQRAFESLSGRKLDRFFERWIYGTDIPRLTYHVTTQDRSVNVRFEQSAEMIFDVPVTVTLTYTDGRTQDVVVKVTDAQVEQTIPTAGAVRQVQVNRDNAALAEFDQR